MSPISITILLLGSSAMPAARAIEHQSAMPSPELRLRLSRTLASRQPERPTTDVGDRGIRDIEPAPAMSDGLPGLLAAGSLQAVMLAQAGGGATVTVTPSPADDEPASGATVTASPRRDDDTQAPESERRPSVAPGRPNEAPTLEEAPEGKKYGVAPIRWGGNIGYSHGRHRGDDGETSTSNSYEISGQASSYILQPWIALVNGGATLVLTSSDSDDGSGTSGGGSKNVAVSGNLGTSIFPVSRFPFSLNFRTSDTRTDSTSFDRNRRTYRLTARQDYRPARGSWNTHATYDWDRAQTDDGSDDTVHRLTGGHRWKGGNQTLESSVTLSRNQRDDGFESDIAILTVDHTARPRQDFSVSSNASYLYDKRSQGLGGSSSQLQSLQAYSAANWNPTSSPWSANASARIAAAKGNDGAVSESLALGGGGSYRYNRNLTFGASVNASTVTATDGGRDIVTTQFLNANYAGDPLIFGTVSYNWGLNASGSNVTAPQGSSQSLSSSANHSLNKSWQPSANSSLGVSGSQSVSHSKNRGEASSSTSSFSNSVSLNLQVMPSSRSQAATSFAFTDSRTFGEQSSHFQLASLQFDGNLILSQYSAFSGNIGVQKSWRQQGELDDTETEVDPDADPFAIDTSDEEDSNTSVNGSLTYYHSRAFNVRDLRYSLRFTASTATSNERESGNPDATDERKTRILEQDLDYRIGRLDTQLKMRVAEIDGRKNALLLFRVTRSFGSF